MFYGQDRASMRQVFFDVWRRCKHAPSALTALERQIAEVIQDHPEFHGFFCGQETWKEEDQQQLFMQLGLHLAVRDQIQLNKPRGVQQIFQQLCWRGYTSMDAEHQIMACLSQVMWEAQQQGRALSEQDYEDLLKKL